MSDLRLTDAEVEELACGANVVLQDELAVVERIIAARLSALEAENERLRKVEAEFDRYYSHTADGIPCQAEAERDAALSAVRAARVLAEEMGVADPASGLGVVTWADKFRAALDRAASIESEDKE